MTNTGKIPVVVFVVRVRQWRERTTIMFTLNQRALIKAVMQYKHQSVSSLIDIDKHFLGGNNKKDMNCPDTEVFVMCNNKEFFVMSNNDEVPSCATCFEMLLHSKLMLGHLGNHQSKSSATNNFKCSFFLSFLLMRKTRVRWG